MKPRRGRPLRVEVAPAPAPLALVEVEAWVDRYLEYILDREKLALPLQKPGAAA